MSEKNNGKTLAVSPDVQWLLQEMDKKIETRFDTVNSNINHLESNINHLEEMLASYNNNIESRFNRHWGIFKGLFVFFGLCVVALLFNK